MISFKKILVPTDFSANCINAYTHAQELAQSFGSRIDLMHVVPTMKYFADSISNLGIPFDMEKDLYPKVMKEAKHKLKNALDDYIVEENKGEVTVLTGRKPYKLIVEEARKEEYDIIVMAALGAHESDLIKGTVTEKVIRESEIPVFTVDNRLKADGIKKILVPTDTSENSFSCLPIALTLADIYEAELILFHVLELYGSISESIERTPGKTNKEDIYEVIRNHIDDYLIHNDLDNVLLRRGEVIYKDQFVITDGTSSKTINVTTVIEKGVSAHYEIENYAPENSDIVVMTTHGHSGLAHFFLGSTTEKVVQHLDMPVVTIKPGIN